MLNPELLQQTRQLLNVFRINDKPAGEEMSEGQVLIAASIIYKIKPRVATLAPTGYGKSEAVSMGAIIRTCVFHESFIVASVKFGTSDIIMQKTIEHIFDDDSFVDQLEIDKSQQLSRLKRERKKSHLTFKKGGSLKIISLHGADEDISKAIGEHEPNIILDESPLLSPGKYLQVLKILEGTGKYDETFLFELGNAVNRNHFRENVKFNPKYLKIDISLEQAIAEGRLDPESVDEKRSLPFFEQFYDCNFPDADEVDEKGYRVLLTDEDIENAFIDEIPEGEKDWLLGIDVAGGGDYNAYILKNRKFAWIDRANKSNDTMTNVTETEDIIEKREVKAEDIFIDDIGIGRGVSDRLKEKGHQINAISVGERAKDPARFKNIKAEAYWNVRLWVKAGGKLKRDERFRQLTWIKYKISTDKMLQIEPKEDLKKRMGKSPDFAESLMLTFAPKKQPRVTWI